MIYLVRCNTVRTIAHIHSRFEYDGSWQVAHIIIFSKAASPNNGTEKAGDLESRRSRGRSRRATYTGSDGQTYWMIFYYEDIVIFFRFLDVALALIFRSAFEFGGKSQPEILHVDSFWSLQSVLHPHMRVSSLFHALPRVDVCSCYDCSGWLPPSSSSTLSTLLSFFV